jgi:protein-S-isoprenylcysteine O-methyltransferase Ste14
VRFEPLRILGYVWLAFLAVWVLLWFRNKPTLQTQPPRSRAIQLGLGVVAALLLAGRFPFPVLNTRFLPPSLPIEIIGLSIGILGVLFAIWARLVLGGNWSSNVTLKENHTLIRTGPYSVVRHPIYTGILFSILGTVLASGRISSLLGLAVAAWMLRLKLSVEENFMLQQFGSQYLQYRRGVKMLVPFVF